jgi:AraC-like DNA-binding protein
MTFQLPADQEMQFANEPPADYCGPRLPGAMTLQGATDAYSILVQQLSHQLYRISYHVFHFFKKSSLEYSSDKEGLHTQAALSNHARHSFNGIGKMNILEGQYAALWCEHAKGQTRFEADADYRIFDIFYSPQLAAELSDAFEGLAEVIHARVTIPLSRNPHWLNYAMRDAIKQIMECPYDEATRAFYFDLKVREYLLLALYTIYDPSKINSRFSASEAEKIFEARKLLLKDLNQPAYSIKSLSMAVGLNEFTLKGGFQHYFQLGVFECFQRARMEKAKELLLTTNKAIKEICILAGYPRITNFIRAFRNVFGYPPGELRRK